MPAVSCKLFVVVLFLASTCAADNWPQWRGPTGNGVATGTSFPLQWSEANNVAWKIDLPGTGASTPILWENQLFVTCGVNGVNTLLCYDRAGKLSWQREVGSERTGKHRKATGSNPSAVTDGKHLVVYFKSGDLACFDLQGNPLWRHNLQQQFGADTLWWDLGTSPVMTSAHIVVACMHSGPSYVAAFDKATGQLAWKCERNLDAPVEAAQSYSTPVVVGAGAEEQLIVLGADHVTAHDAASGRELWRVGGLNPKQDQYFRSIASAVVAGDIVVAPYARGNTITAVRLGGRGDVTKSHVAWTVEGWGADVPTPAARDGLAYVCTDKGRVVCLDVKTGGEVWSRDLGRSRDAFSASPILAGGRLYLTREDGTTFVVDAAGDHAVLAENKVDGRTVSTPVFADGRLYLRTYDRLYCIGTADAAGSE